MAATEVQTRASSAKPAMTRPNLLLPEREAAEVLERTQAYYDELQPSGMVGQTLVRLAATMSARIERHVGYETAVLNARVRRAEAEFVAPEGVDEATAAKLRVEAGWLALFDPSPEASLARKYEAAAERSFFRALKELRLLKKQEKAVQEERIDEALASILPGRKTDEEFQARQARMKAATPPKPVDRGESIDFSTLRGRVDVPFSIGKHR